MKKIMEDELMGSTKVKRRVLNIIKAFILPIAIFAVLIIGTGGRFGNSATILQILRQSVILIIIAMAIGSNMTMGMWDFSAGAVIANAAIIGALFMTNTGMGIPGLVIMCMVVAVAHSVLTGLLYNLMKVPSIVLTIGLVMIYESIPRLISVSSANIQMEDGILSQSPWCFIILGIMIAVFHILSNYTAFGNNVRAIGANISIAYSAGVNLSKTKLISFLWSGVFLGVASFMSISNSGSAYAPATFGSVVTIFDAMMGIFIAFFLQRYCNYTMGIVIGIFSMNMLNTGLVMLGLESTMRSVASGIFLVVLLIVSSNQAVVDEIRRRKRLKVKAEEQYTLMRESGKKHEESF